MERMACPECHCLARDVGCASVHGTKCQTMHTLKRGEARDWKSRSEEYDYEY